MRDINASSDKISRIIKVIEEIAFQTNILALNAAVEAARAGEAGMGFAVVADEVRNLAQRSSQAARDTTELIQESIANSQEGRSRLAQVTETFSSIIGSVGQMKTLIEEVHLGSQEQARGIEQVSHAISQMEQVTQQTAAAAEEGAAAGEQMSAQSDTLREVVGRMAVLLDGVAHRDDVRPGVEPALGRPSRSLRSANPASAHAGHLSPQFRL
jgi:methyl-accepting chemotaxis protein